MSVLLLQISAPVGVYAVTLQDDWSSFSGLINIEYYFVVVTKEDFKESGFCVFDLGYEIFEVFDLL